MCIRGRAIDVSRVIGLRRAYLEIHDAPDAIREFLHAEFEREYNATGLISVDGILGVMVTEYSMTDIAPLDKWTLNVSRDDKSYPYRHEIHVQGIMFYAITEDTINPCPKPAKDEDLADLGQLE